MAIQTISLSHIAKRWAEALSNDEKINTFCEKHYHRKLNLYIGYDEADAPNEEDCPCAILLINSKGEGLAEQYTYTLCVIWGIFQKSVTRKDNIVTYEGTFESDELGQLIIECIAGINPSYPVINIDYECDNLSWRPVYPGRATLTIEMPHVIGGMIEY